MCEIMEELMNEGRAAWLAEGRAEGLAEGRAETEIKMKKLIKFLIADNRLDDLDNPDTNLEQLYKEYGVEN